MHDRRYSDANARRCTHVPRTAKRARRELRETQSKVTFDAVNVIKRFPGEVLRVERLTLQAEATAGTPGGEQRGRLRTARQGGAYFAFVLFDCIIYKIEYSFLLE